MAGPMWAFSVVVSPRERPSPTSGLVAALSVLSLIAFVVLLVSGSVEALPDMYIAALERPGQVLLVFVPVALSGIAGALAYRAGYWNIGMEGQLLMGAITCLWASLISGSTLVGVMAGALAGAAWGGITGVLRGYTGANEAVTTFMMNLVALQLLYYVSYGALRDPSVKGFPYTYPVPSTVDPLAAAGAVVALAVAVHVLLNYTGLGLSFKVMGDGVEVARYAGIDIARTTILASSISGTLAGIGGALELAAFQGFLQPGFSPGYGYIGIAASWLGFLKPLWVLASSAFVALTYVGIDGLRVGYGVPTALAYAAMGMIIVGVLVGILVYRYRIRIVL